MTKTRIEKLTKEEVEIIFDAFQAPSWMMANIDIGGSYTMANYGLTIKKENGEYIALIEVA